MSATWINWNDFEKDLKLVGWMASVSTDKDGNELKVAEHCIKSGHMTPTRIMRFIFEIECSRVCSHELVRHEVGVIKVQQSQRYCKADEYIMPPELEKIDGAEYIFSECELAYNQLLDMGIKKEIARYTLSNATKTKLRVCFDFEGLANFFQKRLCSRAQPEMRELAEEIYKEIFSNVPRQYHQMLQEHFGRKCEIAGYCNEVQCCGYKPKKEKFMETYERGRFIEEGK